MSRTLNVKLALPVKLGDASNTRYCRKSGPIVSSTTIRRSSIDGATELLSVPLSDAGRVTI